MDSHRNRIDTYILVYFYNDSVLTPCKELESILQFLAPCTEIRSHYFVGRTTLAITAFKQGVRIESILTPRFKQSCVSLLT